MHDVMDCAFGGGWLAGGIALLVVALLLLGIAALAKHLFFDRATSGATTS